MSKYASEVVKQAKAWLGKNEADGSHKTIIDIYNKHKPLARGYKMNYHSDPWCAVFVSAVSIKLGYTDIMPTECGCENMIELYKQLGCWREDENVMPKPGWICFYDWQDNGTGNNLGYTDHVGIVTDVFINSFDVIEGNFDNAVKTRRLSKNGKFIRGFAVPNYSKEVSNDLSEYVVKPGDTLSGIASTFHTSVKELMILNSAIIQDENDIQIGWKITVPRSKGSEDVLKPSKDYEAIGRAVVKCSEDIEKLESYADLLTLL